MRHLFYWTLAIACVLIACTEPQQEEVSNRQIAEAMSTQPDSIVSRLKIAESFFYQKDYEEAKKQFEQLKKITTNSNLKKLADQRMASCQAAIDTIPKIEPEPELEPPTLAWWNNIDTVWQEILRAEYFQGEAEQENIEKIFDNKLTIDINNRKDINSLEALQPLKKIVHVNLKSTNINDISPLAGLGKLRSIDATNTKITTIAPLDSNTSVQILKMAYTKVSDLSPLLNNDYIIELDLTSTPFKEVSILENFQRLKYLKINNTKPTSFDALRKLTSLRNLFMASTGIDDLAVLKDLIDLRVLEISGNPVNSLEPIMKINDLERLYCRNTKIPRQEIEAFKKVHPRCQVFSDF